MFEYDEATDKTHVVIDGFTIGEINGRVTNQRNGVPADESQRQDFVGIFESCDSLTRDKILLALIE